MSRPRPSRSARTAEQSTANTTQPTTSNSSSMSHTSPPAPTSAEDATEQHFACRICLETPTGPVVTACGHLACWKCLHAWLDLRPYQPTCPVCKAPCSKDQVIPVYGAGLEEKDPRTCPLPKPPRAQGLSLGRSSTTITAGLRESLAQLTCPDFSISNPAKVFKPLLQQALVIGLLVALSRGSSHLAGDALADTAVQYTS